MVKTFRGKNLDMSSVIESNGNVIAAGNSVFNARGDLLGPGGRIIKTREQLENEYVRNNPDAVRQRTEDVVGFNRGLGEYTNKVSQETILDDVKPTDPTKVTRKHNRNLETSPKERVKFSDTVEEKTLDSLPLDDDFETI